MLFFRYKPRGLNKSTLIMVISVVENYASAMMTLILPLYLFDVFQSEFTVGRVYTFASFLGLVITLSLGMVLTKISRTLVYKIGIFLGITSICIFGILSHISEAYIARSLFVIAGILTPAILSLYIRDLTTPKDLPHVQGIYSAMVNIAWLTGPMLAGLSISFFTTYQTYFLDFTLFQNSEIQYFPYMASFCIALLLYVLALSIFSWHKFVVKHPHLQETKTSNTSNQVHHHRYLANIFEHFRHPKRALSFINLSFIAIWWVFVFTYMALLLEQHGVHPTYIGVLIGAISLPNVLLEGFVDKVIKKCQGSTNALLVGYTFFFVFVIVAFLIGTEHIYLFTFCIIFSQIGVAITEPLQELQYFEGTTETTEGKFYAIHKFGNQFFSLVTPVVVGWMIAIWGIDTTFHVVPFLFLPLFFLLFYLRKKDV